MQTDLKNLTVRLRAEGNAVVLAIPLVVRRELAIKGGDLLVMRVVDGNIIARKVDLSGVRASLEAAQKEVAG